MKINSKTPPITAMEARNILQMHTDSFGVFLDLDRILEYTFEYTLRLSKYTKALCNISKVPDYKVTNANETKSILINRLGVDPAALTVRGKVTTDGKLLKKIAEDVKGSNTALEEFLSYYIPARSVSQLLSYLNSYLELPIVNCVDNDKHRMVVAHPTWSILSTSRIGASEPNIQQISRTIGDIITAPEGYRLIRSDSGQIEPRIMWSHFIPDKLMANLITAYDDAYMAYYDYITMRPEREEKLRNDFENNFVKLEITDEVRSKRQELKRMSLAAGYGSSLPADAGFDPQLARLYTARISNHTLRKVQEQKITDYVENGGDTFYGAFGTPVKPDATDKYEPGKDGWTKHLIRCGINNPIQTTASELMLFAVNRAHGIINSKCKDSHIGYYKHDEGCFYLNEDNGDVDYADELGACQSYEVEGWIPIHSEMEIGRKKWNEDVVRLL